MNIFFKSFLFFTTLSCVTLLLMVSVDEYEVLQCNNECMCVIKYKEDYNDMSTVIYYDNVLHRRDECHVQYSDMNNIIGDYMTYCNNNH